MKVPNFIQGAFSGCVLTAFGFLFISGGYETSMKKTCIENTELTRNHCSKLATKSITLPYMNYIILGSIVGGVGYSIKKSEK